MINQLFDKAVTLHQDGRHREAERLYKAVLGLDPGYFAGLHLLGVIEFQRHCPEMAARLIRRAVAGEQGVADYFNNLAVSLQDPRQAKEAAALLLRAGVLAPSYADALYNLGNAFRDTGNPSLAARLYRRALIIHPQMLGALTNLANVAASQLNLANSADCLKRAIAAAPHSREAYSNLGNIFRQMGRLAEGEALHRRALWIEPNSAEASWLYSVFLFLQRKPGQARPLAKAAADGAVGKTRALALSHLATVKAYLSDFAEVKALSDAAMMIAPTDSSLWEQRLYMLSYHSDLSAEEIFSEFIKWGDLQAVDSPARVHPAPRGAEARRPRIGFVSPDFRRHTSRFNFAPLFENHDHQAFELFAYSNVAAADDFTAKFETMFDHWRTIRHLSDEDADALITRDGIDILVDGCNHMENHRLGVFARKPAPLQATWLGSAWTSGLAAMDYVLFDRTLAPPETLAREAIIRLPHTFVAYRPPTDTAAVALPPCLRNGYVTFGYYGRTERLNHRVFRLWGRLLASLPKARLILDFRPFADPETCRWYESFLAAHGVDTRRVTLRYSPRLWEALNDIDIMLDSFPHSGGTMILDCIWMAVPLVTLASRPPIGRIGASYMTALGLADWVATSEDDYLAKARRFAGDPEALAALRLGMRERVARSPLMNEHGFTRAVEAAYRGMWERRCLGLPPAAFDIPAETYR